MNGTIRLYNQNGMRIRTGFYVNKEDRARLISRWRAWYGFEFERWYFHISPYIYNPQVVNIEKVVNIESKVINKKMVVTNRPLKDIEMPDFTPVGFGKHESYYHYCYCKGEK